VSLLRFVFRLLLGRRLPITRGELKVPGLFGSVQVRRDHWGIPLIDADDDRDGAYAIGFCQGQDRAFQLEILLRITRGTLAELLGPSMLPVDRLSRRVGFHTVSKEQLTALEPEVLELLEAYARGAQAGIALGLQRLPHEFAILKGRPTPWTAADTLATTKLLSFTLTTNWDAELVRLKVLTTDGPDALRAVDAAYPAWLPVIAPVGQSAGTAIDRLAGDLDAFLSFMKPGGGSNNWVLAGSRTRSGRPILANDPHLEASLPAFWYLARIRTREGTLAGATFVGGPSLPIGHNGTACWGVTAGMVDNTDLFLEEIGPDGASVRQSDGFVPCRVREEIIQVKGSDPVTERVLITPRGPIISPSLHEAPSALSLRATWLDPLPIHGFMRMHRVRSFADLQAACADWPASSQNIVYADTSGAIGWQLIGRAPVRKQGHGLLPLPGWAPGVGWHDEAVPQHEMPHLENPAKGFIASANSKPTPDGAGPFLGVDFIDGYRLRAILEALEPRHDWDVAATMSLQLEQRTWAWPDMRDVVLSAPATDDAAKQGLALLRDWDGTLSAASPAAAVYELFVAAMVRRVARAKAPGSWRWVVGAGLGALTSYNFGSFRRTGQLVGLLREQPAGWFAHSWLEEVAAALSEAVGALRARFGDDSRRWAWGALRGLVMHHPMSRAPGPLGRALAGIFNLGPIPCGGDSDTINQAATLPLDPLALSNNIASLRSVFDVGAWQNSRFCLPGGQSGNPLSPHYGDLFELWQKGDGVPIAFTDEEVRAAGVEALSLVPDQKSP
jgi:penicillin G amidase